MNSLSHVIRMSRADTDCQRMSSVFVVLLFSSLITMDGPNCTTEEICSFLEERRVPESVIENFRMNKIDGKCIPLLIDEHFNGLGLTAVGDIVMLRSFASRCPASSSQEDTDEGDAQKNEPKKRRANLLKKLLEDFSPNSKSSVPSSPNFAKKSKLKAKRAIGRPKSEKKCVQVGLRRAKPETNYFSPVKSPLGDQNTLTLDVNYDDSYIEVLNFFVNEFFPEGMNPKLGKSTRYNFSVVNAANESVENQIDDFSLRGYMAKKKVRGNIRLHLLCTETDLISDDELPDLMSVQEQQLMLTPIAANTCMSREIMSNSSASVPPVITSTPVNQPESHLGPELNLSGSSEDFEDYIIKSAPAPYLDNQIDTNFQKGTNTVDNNFIHLTFQNASNDQSVTNASVGECSLLTGQVVIVPDLPPISVRQSVPPLSTDQIYPSFSVQNTETPVVGINVTITDTGFTHSICNGQIQSVPSTVQTSLAPSCCTVSPRLTSTNNQPDTVNQSTKNICNDNGFIAETSLPSETTLSIISKLNMQVSHNNPIILNIVRGNVLDGGFRAFSRKSFRPETSLNVRFIGEEGIDEGGPRREFMSLAIEELKHLPIFSEEGNLKRNNKALDEKLYFKAGQMLAYCIVHNNGSAAQIFSTLLYDMLCGLDVSPGIQDVYDDELQNTLTKMSESTTEEDFDDSCANSWEWVLISACTSLARFKYKDDMVKAMCKFLVCDRLHGALEQLKRGMECLGVLQCMRKYPEQLRDIFVKNRNTGLSAASFSAIFQKKFSEPHSNRRRLEEKAVSFWEDILLDIEEEATLEKNTEKNSESENEEKIGITFSQLLQFITSYSQVPLLGFEPVPAVSFNHEADLPPDKKHLAGNFLVNTCAMEIRLPMINSYENFKHLLVQTVNQQNAFTAP